jgi:diphosphomevalonate decarboxylase
MQTTSQTATAVSHPNIAFIKYWGNRDPDLRIPANGSISMNLEGLQTTTTVRFDPALEGDQLSINSTAATISRPGPGLPRRRLPSPP